MNQVLFLHTVSWKILLTKLWSINFNWKNKNEKRAVLTNIIFCVFPPLFSMEVSVVFCMVIPSRPHMLSFWTRTKIKRSLWSSDSQVVNKIIRFQLFTQENHVFREFVRDLYEIWAERKVPILLTWEQEGNLRREVQKSPERNRFFGALFLLDPSQ